MCTIHESPGSFSSSKPFRKDVNAVPSLQVAKRKSLQATLYPRKALWNSACCILEVKVCKGIIDCALLEESKDEDIRRAYLRNILGTVWIFVMQGSKCGFIMTLRCTWKPCGNLNDIVNCPTEEEANWVGIGWHPLAFERIICHNHKNPHGKGSSMDSLQHATDLKGLSVTKVSAPFELQPECSVGPGEIPALTIGCTSKRRQKYGLGPELELVLER
ncbi:hypothetical protein EV368DRAFT_67282 [Lentinula lateritia]|nr:hypothetical protein EV368DRAFT_67282 [Lentinula lateritia]